MTLNISVVSHSHDPQPLPDVHYVQNVLKRKGLYPYLVDGIFGDKTRAGVVKFQKQNSLYPDGIVGPATYKRLHDGDPVRPALTDAARMADLAYRLLVKDGLDGTRPRYVFGSEVSMRDASPDKLDCSEAVQWAVTQVDGNTWVDGSANQYGACHHITVDQARHIKGALVFSSSNGHQSGVHHVGVSLGNGMTAEARSTARGCGSWPIDSRFNLAGTIPLLKY